jgi:uncharacterized YceG family protein
MADGHERSAAEREAARLERERRRAGRGEPSDAAAPTESQPLVVDDQPQPEADGDVAHDDHEVAYDDHEVAYDDHEVEYDDDEAEYGDGEAPLGIKRVPRLQRLRAPDAPQIPNRPRAQKRRPRRRVTSRSGRIMSLLALLLVGAVIWFLYGLFQPFHGSGHGRVTVTIPAHSSSGAIGDLLERDGVISSSFFFELRATLDGERSALRSGTYHLKLDMNYSDVLKALTTAPPPVPTTTLTLIEGKSRRQIDPLLRSQGIRGSYVADTRRSHLLDPTRYGAPRSTPSLEGFLFPSTYQLRKPVSIRVLVDKQLTTFKQQFARVKLRYARSRHLSAYDVLIIASIIEKEAGTVHDRPLVASVIYNRLKDHMPLGMDSTTRYEFNDYSRSLTSSQLAVNSPYNTRLNAGLPPTPIGNPGLAAIEAAANPARTNYLYFVVKTCGNGSSVFSSNYQQFLRDSARYQNARAKRGGSPAHC